MILPAVPTKPVHCWFVVTRRAAFSLIEVLIAVTLMSVIVLGLMAMFGETQRAFRTGINQVDIMEGGRSAIELMGREVEQAVATDMEFGTNFVVTGNNYVLFQELPGQQPVGPTPAIRTNILQSLRFCTREGQQWAGIGYTVLYTNNIGTLYRSQTNVSQVGYPGPDLATGLIFQAPLDRVLDNVVDLRFRTYDSLGRLLSPNWNFKTISKRVISYRVSGVPGREDEILVEFKSNAIPAYVEIELGVLDSKVAARARTIGDDSLNAQRLYLEKQAGSVQLFRRRIPIRNVDPSVYQ